MDEYKNITKILVWIVVVSTVAYFVLLPVSFTRPTPSKTSPETTGGVLQANPFRVETLYQNVNSTSTTSTTSTEDLKLPKPLMEVGE